MEKIFEFFFLIIFENAKVMQIQQNTRIENGRKRNADAVALEIEDNNY